MFWLRLFKADYLNRNMEFPGGNIKIEWMHIHLRWSFQVAFATYIVPILNDNFFSMKSTDFYWFSRTVFSLSFTIFKNHLIFV